jgi:hypothetical protein
MQLGDKSLRTMERLVRAQRKRPDAPVPVSTGNLPLAASR